METNVSLCGKAALCLILLTAGCLRSAIAGQIDEASGHRVGLAMTESVATGSQGR